MLGRFRFRDEALHGSDGTFDSAGTVIVMGVLFPLAMVGLVVWAFISGGVTIRGRVGTPFRYEGWQAVLSASSFCIGVALLLMAHYLLPNIFRTSYRYQYVAIAGGVLAVGGLLWFAGSAMMR